MSSTLTNKHNLPTPMAVALAYDNYDYIDIPNYYSATTIIKSIRKIIMTDRAKKATSGPVLQLDVSDLTASSLGTAFHDRAESIFYDKQKYSRVLAKLGWSEEDINRIRVNPEEPVPAGYIPVYVERRVIGKLGKFHIGAKYDYIWDGDLADYKTCSVYSFGKPDKEEEWRLQGSINRWLNQDKVKHDHVTINMLFKDFSPNKAAQAKKGTYPPSNPHTIQIPLMTPRETKEYLQNKCQQLEYYANAPDGDIPLCSQQDLWQSAPKFRYYAKGVVTPRATRVFDSVTEAIKYQSEKNGAGIIVESPGEVKACNYCAGRTVCEQYTSLVTGGLVTPSE